MNRLLRVTGALCVAVGLAACGVQDDGGGGERYLPAEEGVRSLSLPFDEYTLSPFEMRTLDYAQDLLVRDCMRQHGMDWRVLPDPEEEGTDPPHRGRYGVIESEVAERYGYGAPPGSADEALVEEVREDRLTLLATEHRVAYGSESAAGCLPEAGRDIMAGVPDMDHDRLNSFIQTGFETSRSAPEVVDAFAAWSACMADRGFDYPTPSEAPIDARWSGGEGDPSTEETEVAAVDVACKEDVSVVEIWRDAEAVAQERLIEEHPEDFALFAQVRQIRLETARTAIERFGA
ncbi:hypothetical protein [Nocardiopsis sp. B62]|uniref:hypothetical protein n=1 Tax=Nocardiopsis sp. B62 TaxID=2824874 RepID=UPI001B36EB2A|nr:hypothetical protein [Nocardiopsis sp. B62]MBQ1082068.1 hypothetical protein [Nocardiopsis sp. B62]